MTRQVSGWNRWRKKKRAEAAPVVAVRPEVGRAELEAMDRRLVELGRGAGARRLELGLALVRFSEASRWLALGFSGFEAYVTERVGQGARWAADTRKMAERLGQLPLLRAAVGRGEVNWSAAEVLARKLTPENEVLGLAAARGKTVRQLKQMFGAPAEEGDSGDDGMCTLAVTVDREDAWALQHTRMLVEAITGSRRTEELVEAMLAEGATELSVKAGLEIPDVPERKPDPAGEDAMAELMASTEEFCEQFFGPVDVAGLEWVEPEFPDGARELDAMIVRLSKGIAAREVELLEVALAFHEVDGWGRLRYASLRQYCRERVGISESSWKKKVKLAQAMREMSEIGEAVREGEIGVSAAQLVARVARPEVAGAWVARAKERTAVHLKEEVEVVQHVAVAEGVDLKKTAVEPPDDELMAAYGQLRAKVLSGEIYREDAPASEQMSGEAWEAPPGLGQMSGGRVTVKLRMRSDQLAMWRAVEAMHRRAAVGLPFVAYLCVAVWRAWAHVLNPDVAYGQIYLRDGYRCSSPVCTRRDVTPHHVVFRSRGGGDEDENVVSLCSWCHLEGVHGGRIRATGKAGALRFELGVGEPVVVVDGRRVVRR